MAQGRVNLENPASHAFSRGADEEAAAPLLGDAPTSPAAGRRYSCRRELCCYLIIVSLAVAMTAAYCYLLYANLPSFTVHLAGLDGVDPAHPARVVSPTFNLTLRMTKTCADRADVVVTYAGVALGWARVAPGNCPSNWTYGGAAMTKRRPRMDVAFVARGEGVGLSRGLRERMAEERRRMGAVELDVEVIVYNDGPHERLFGADVDVADDKVMVCKLMTDGIHASESEACTWYSLEPLSSSGEIE